MESNTGEFSMQIMSFNMVNKNILHQLFMFDHRHKTGSARVIASIALSWVVEQRSGQAEPISSLLLSWHSGPKGVLGFTGEDDA